MLKGQNYQATSETPNPVVERPESEHRAVINRQLTTVSRLFEDAIKDHNVRLQRRYYANVKFMIEILRGVSRVSGDERDKKLLVELYKQRLRMAGLLE